MNKMLEKDKTLINIDIAFQARRWSIYFLRNKIFTWNMINRVSQAIIYVCNLVCISIHDYQYWIFLKRDCYLLIEKANCFKE